MWGAVKKSFVFWFLVDSSHWEASAWHPPQAEGFSFSSSERSSMDMSTCCSCLRLLTPPILAEKCLKIAGVVLAAILEALAPLFTGLPLPPAHLMILWIAVWAGLSGAAFLAWAYTGIFSQRLVHWRLAGLRWPQLGWLVSAHRPTG